MAVFYSKKEQGNTFATGTGVPVHAAIAGDEYTDTSTGITYVYTTYWGAVLNVSNGTPTIVAGAGAGTSPTVSVTKTDTGMQITVTTGALPTGTNAIVATVTFANPFSAVPTVVFSAVNNAASALSGATMVTMDAGSSKTTFIITSGLTGLVAATTYVWNAICR